MKPPPWEVPPLVYPSIIYSFISQFSHISGLLDHRAIEAKEKEFQAVSECHAVHTDPPQYCSVLSVRIVIPSMDHKGRQNKNRRLRSLRGRVPAALNSLFLVPASLLFTIGAQALTTTSLPPLSKNASMACNIGHWTLHFHLCERARLFYNFYAPQYNAQ